MYTSFPFAKKKKKEEIKWCSEIQSNDTFLKFFVVHDGFHYRTEFHDLLMKELNLEAQQQVQAV